MNASIVTIIVNYRLARQTASAAASCLAQEISNKVWVVDNSEDPDEAELLRTMLDTRCRLIVNERNLGFGAACNDVYARTTSEFVFLLNPDAYCEPNALWLLAECLLRNPRAGGVTPRAWYDAGHQIRMPFLHPYPWWHAMLTASLSSLVGRAIWAWSLRRRAETLHVWRSDHPHRLAHAGLVGGHCLLRRAAVDAVGGLFDPRFFLYAEDTDLSYRLRSGGWELMQEPRAAVVHTFGGTARDRAEWKHTQAQHAEQLLLEKFYGRNLRYRWLRRINRRLPGKPWQPATQVYPRPSKMPGWDVPTRWERGWLIEIASNPYLIAPMGILGRGRRAEIPYTLAGQLPPGTYWARFGPATPAWLSPDISQFQILPSKSDAPVRAESAGQTPWPLVSVIVRTKDRPERLLEALSAVAHQSYPRIELVVVNDGGTDVAHLVDDFAAAVVATRYENLPRNMGRAAAANVGLDAARGEYLIFLDDDDLFKPDHIAALVGALRAAPDKLLAYTGTLQVGHGRSEVWSLPFDRVRLQTFGLFAIHAALFSRRLLEHGCRFDETLQAHEDWDFWLQAAEKTDFIHVNQVSAIYRHLGSSGVSAFNFDPVRAEAQRAQLMRKWTGRWSSQELAQQVECARSLYLSLSVGLRAQQQATADGGAVRRIRQPGATGRLLALPYRVARRVRRLWRREKPSPAKKII
ncbi:MAG: glycosyltransferase [Caldilinea sp.]|nr:glycosyltransferase [Caldilinea sp.]